MLVLSRVENEGITFPDLDLKVKVLRIQGNRVQIGIDANPKIRALRSELVTIDSAKEYANRPICDLQRQINQMQQTLDIAQRQLDRGELKRVEWTLEQLQPERGMISTVSEPACIYEVSPTLPVQLAC